MMKCESSSSRFQPGEGPSMDLLDCETLNFEKVVSSSKLFSDLNFQQNITPINTKQLQYV